jgi:hypothetical protein
MRRLRFYLRHAVDPDRIDVVEVREGAVLLDSQANTRHTPLINVSQLERVELIDDEAASEESRMSESTILRRLEARNPAAYAVRRAQIEALTAEGWAIREGTGGFIAELGGRRGCFALTLDELLKRVLST